MLKLVKKNSKTKRHMQKHSKSRSSKSKRSNTSRKSKSMRNSRRHKKNNKRSKRSSRRNLHGGGDCRLSTVMEPSFIIDDIGAAKGINISESRGIIYRPNCKADTYQAMTP